MQHEMHVLGIDIAKRVFHLVGINDRGKIGWCPSIAWMKGRRSDVDRSLVELGVQVMWHARAQPFCHGPHRVRQTCCHARRDACPCLGDPAR